jgi:hypothetical protein
MKKEDRKMDSMQAHRLLLGALITLDAGGTLSDDTIKLLADYFQVPTPEEYARGVPFPDAPRRRGRRSRR